MTPLSERFFAIANRGKSNIWQRQQQRAKQPVTAHDARVSMVSEESFDGRNALLLLSATTTSANHNNNNTNSSRQIFDAPRVVGAPSTQFHGQIYRVCN